jgi:hypothetical protein
VSPLLVNLKNTSPSIYESGRENVLLYGMPSYIDWVLKSTELFIFPKSVEYLESLDVMCSPEINLEEVADDIIKWAVSNKSYKYSFSEQAKQANQAKYEGYLRRTEDMENDTSYDDFLSPRYHESQAYIDDAFGGETDAYWNID